jgi:hypothetical protein
MSISQLYETDFYAWTLKIAELLKQNRFSELDTDNLIEEVEGMGKSEVRALESRLEVLIAHLLKWQFQQERRSNSWYATILEQRKRIEILLRKNPSLKNVLADIFNDAYEVAIFAASKETGFKPTVFPKECPYTIQQILNNEYLPEAET